MWVRARAVVSGVFRCAGLLPELEALGVAAQQAGPQLQQQELTARERALRILSFVAARWNPDGSVRIREGVRWEVVGGGGKADMPR